MRISSTELAQRVAERKEKLFKYVPFIEKLVEEYGHVRNRQQETPNTDRKELEKVRGFTFTVVRSPLNSEGNTVEAFYYTPTVPRQEDTTMLEINYKGGNFNSGTCLVKLFRDENVVKWQEALDSLIEDKEKVIQDLEALKQAEHNRIMEGENKAMAYLALQDEAKRLGITA